MYGVYGLDLGLNGCVPESEAGLRYLKSWQKQRFAPLPTTGLPLDSLDMNNPEVWEVLYPRELMRFRVGVSARLTGLRGFCHLDNLS